MGISGDNTPNRSVVMVEPTDPFTVVSGRLYEETAPAVELTTRLVSAWQEGLRDLRSPSLAPLYSETPRSRVGSDDGPDRYARIVEVAEELGVSPPDQTEFVRFFLPNAAASVFVESLTRLGVELTWIDDLVDVDASVLEYRNPVQPVLVGQQEVGERRISTETVAALLEQIDFPAMVHTTKHFVDDDPENNAIDVDNKAHERLFTQFGQYLERLLLLK